MKIGDKVKLNKIVSYEGGFLDEGSEWVISNIVQIKKERLALISNDGDRVFTVKLSSLVKFK